MRRFPDRRGRFGPYGGKFVPETLVSALDELGKAYKDAMSDRGFRDELARVLKSFAGRPTPLYHAENFSRRVGKGKIYLKREDLCHTGAHKINNCLGQILLARRMGKTRIIAETGAGQHGVATASAAARFGMECIIYMGEEDMARQSLNVFRMRLLGAEVRPVSSSSRTLKDAINEAMRDWVTNVSTTHYVLGSVAGPHPYPMIVRDFQRVIGKEARSQIIREEGTLPDLLVACVGGGSNAVGLFHPFLGDGEVRMIGVEAGGAGLESGRHAARFASGSVGVLHGALTYILQNENGQIKRTHSVSAGLDYPGIGPEHSYLRETGRVCYGSVTDEEAVAAVETLAETEGILPALETAHAIAYVLNHLDERDRDSLIIINLSGRGDKDVDIIKKWRERVGKDKQQV